MRTPPSGVPGRPLTWLNGRIRFGLFFLIAASLWRWFIHPGPRLSPNVVDAVSGVLYGVSIGCLLTGLRANALRGVGGGQRGSRKGT